MPETLLANRYELLSQLGSGAMGKVWRGRDTTLRRDVAIKTVDLAVRTEDPSVLARFQREAVATAGLSSPNVVGIYDAGRQDHTAYLVMELLDGPSLKTVLAERGPLGWTEGLTIAEGVAHGLAAAHAVGVVHRDIKPGNVVLVDDVPKIVDFGIARLAETGDETLTAPSTVTGTAAYMSPEQARGLEVGPSSDLYSLGCMLMTMFTGGTPFHGDHPIALARAHVSDDPPRMSSRRPDVPAALDALVARLLSKNPAERPDANKAADEFARIAADPGVPAETPTQAMAAVVPMSQRAERTSRIPVVTAAEGTARRQRGILPWVAALVSTAALGGVALLWLNQPHDRVPVPSPTVVQTVTVTPTTSPSETADNAPRTRRPRSTRTTTSTWRPARTTTSSAPPQDRPTVPAPTSTTQTVTTEAGQLRNTQTVAPTPPATGNPGQSAEAPVS
ncbi:serine/threonine-protein kinase [Nigerium massiliense]|uniref:serine/threonine-protein kinase n=1 Tax=Nigerium massiliense TaxID=1522317 RepID=UPI00069457CA|nr:serine/threonine-protein kinase [Nigerium massiliense]